MLRQLCLLTSASAALWAVGCHHSSSPDVTNSVFRLDVNDLSPPSDGMLGELEWHGRVEIGEGVTVDVLLEVTPKGNGTMRVANLRELRVYDIHKDLHDYAEQMLSTTFVDVTGDGYKDLVIHGVARGYAEQGNEDPVSEEAVLFIYTFDPKRRTFTLCYRDASFPLEIWASPDLGKDGRGDQPLVARD